MRNFTTKKGKALLWKLPLVLGCALATSVSAQTPEQVRAIQKQSNLEQLRAVKNAIAQKTPSESLLRRKAKLKGVPFSGEMNGRFYQLRDFDKATGLPIYFVTNNAGAAAGTGTDELYSDFGIFDLSGENMVIYEWDGGAVRGTHQELAGRVTQKDSPASVSDHATHVAGTLIASGVNSKAKGMAYKAKLNAYDWGNDSQEMTAAAADGALVSNHSYGYLGGFEYSQELVAPGWRWYGDDEDTEYKLYGAYTKYSQEWDKITENAPYYLPVKAAGNSRGGGPAPGGQHYVRIKNETTGQFEWKSSTKVRQKNGGADGFDCINHGTTSKNNLVVGAANKLENGYTSAADVQMAPFSSYGPLDDGRIKPDITGIGVGLLSSWSTGDDQYNSISGTSMASPNVAGSIFLLQELYSKENSAAFMRSSTLKALITGTAKEAYSEGPDYSSGWGLLDAFKAASTISLNGTYSLIEQKTLNNNATQTIDVVASGTEPLKVTIAWTDPASIILSDGTQLNDRTKMLVNDLDVKVTEGGKTYLAWVLDPENPGNPATKGDNVTDNVEQVVIKNPTAGATYTITVSHKGQLKKGEEQGGSYTHKDATSQDYGLVVTGINQGVTKDLALTSIYTDVAPSDYTATTPVKFTVENKGTDAFTGAKVHYTFTNKDNGTVISQGDIDFGDLSSGAKLTKEIDFDLSKGFVNYEVKGEITSTGDQVSLNNKSVKEFFGVMADLTQKGSQFSFGFEEPFDKYGWSAEDVDADGRTFRKYDDASLAYEGSSFAVDFPNNKTNVHSWMFSNPLKLKGNKPYRVSFYIRKFGAPEEAVILHLGTSSNSAAMQLIPGTKSEGPANGSYKKYTYEITAPSDDIYYIGFEHKTEGANKSYALGIDNFSIAYAEGVPVVDFEADKKTPTTYDVVTFTDKSETSSSQPVTGYEWVISPATVSFVESTSSTSASPKVKFTQEGKYAVTLKATNVEGVGETTKTDFIEVKNEAVVASFTANKNNIYQGGVVEFTSTSTGKPAPNSFAWTFTPSTGLEFLNGTSATSEAPVVKFNKSGKYTVKLAATSPHNTAEKEEVDFIEVKTAYIPVGDITAEFDKGTTNLKLDWKRPELLPLYEEKFDGDAIPNDMTVIDANSDGNAWKVVGNQAISYSWWGSAFDADDWLITAKIKEGAEVLKFDIQHSYPERYDVYVVAAPASGAAPTVDYIKNNGTAVYTFDATGKETTYKTVSLDIKAHTSQEFYVAYHHRTKASDNAFRVKLDNIYVGYSEASGGRRVDNKVEKDSSDNLKERMLKGDELILEAFSTGEKAQQPKELGVVDVPRLTGYEIVKDGVSKETKSDINDRTYNEVLNTTTGTFTYDIYAVYSDGVKSEKKTIVVNLDTMGTSDVDVKGGVQVYPNPSNGLFTVALGSNVSNFETMVYDLTGKLLFKESFQGNKAELNLTQYSKGVYVLNVVDNNGEQKTVKLVIK